ncbi:hypothetical protein [Methylobacterium aerolatum]|uniref:Ferric-dicitrate binding protein FerR (Iron transport regulator) n=1 Tax=Methylobacterium aerolatum TaxID=418708 RepID=A0ABU0HWU4_9HYPH|nr:hypothetical protein [Methylobacterium aerolatum]MDQ0446810.1 ferric-dicitrate binding protein FerR (iron transport regulator) [Methylobacterium aerolatum]GJD33776.1 hypothetical protein FMGBMHLM_0669 [Methylobacterium aerolatum]
MTEDWREGPLNPVPLAPQAQPQKPTGRELRRQRRRRRRRAEEILAWVLVPLICLGIYWGIAAGFEFMGSSPGQVWDQLMQVKAMMEKRNKT